MSKQLLNERTFSSESVSAFTGGKPVTRTMTYSGTIVRSALFVLITIGFASVVGRPPPTS